MPPSGPSPLKLLTPVSRDDPPPALVGAGRSIAGCRARSALEFEAWQAGVAVAVDERYTHNGRIYRVVQAHTTRAGWEPPVVPALFADEGAAP